MCGRWALNVLLVALGVLMVMPFGWLFSNAMQSEGEAFALPPHWLPEHVTLNNYVEVFRLLPFGIEILNSIAVTLAVVIGCLVTSSLAAYPLARLRFRGRGTMFIVFLSALMIPGQLGVIPIYLLMRVLGLVDTLWSLILPGLIQVFGIFLLRQHFLAVPRELEDAARIDGANHLRVLRHVILPMTGPPMAALAIFVAQQYWNDFFWPNLLLSSRSKMTIPIGLVSLQNAYGSQSPMVIFAAITIIVVPLLLVFLFTQRWITRGISFAGVSQ